MDVVRRASLASSGTATRGPELPHWHAHSVASRRSSSSCVSANAGPAPLDPASMAPESKLLETINTAGPQPSLERWEDMATEFAIRGLDPNLASVSKAEPSIESSKKLRVNSPVRGMAVVPGLAEEVRVRPGSDPVFFYGHLHRSPIRGIEAPCPARPCPQLASQCSAVPRIARCVPAGVKPLRSHNNFNGRGSLELLWQQRRQKAVSGGSPSTFP